MTLPLIMLIPYMKFQSNGMSHIAVIVRTKGNTSLSDQGQSYGLCTLHFLILFPYVKFQPCRGFRLDKNMYKGNNSSIIEARVMDLEHDTSSNHALSIIKF